MAPRLARSRPPSTGSGTPSVSNPPYREGKLSTDPLSSEKLRDIGGHYLDPPGCRSLRRREVRELSAQRLPADLAPDAGRSRAQQPQRRSGGPASLSAASETASGKIIGSLPQRHRATGLKNFLVQIDNEVPPPWRVPDPRQLLHPHDARHRGWLFRHPRCHLHFTPSSGSLVNIVERWLSELAEKKVT